MEQQLSAWLPIIGVEVHIELKTKSKMFCSCPNQHFGEQPNTFVCPVCLGMPGALPVPNKVAIEQTIAIAAALGCKISKKFWFDRKNYFYPDLPKGYQISQHFAPIGVDGKVPILIEGKRKEIGIADIHLEEDTGKLIHCKGETLIDFNRSGVPLVEIVSKPEIHSAKEAKAYLKRIQQVIRYLGFSDCDMEKGSMRLEANVSVTKNQKPKAKSQTWKLPGYKVEIKNLNSFRFVEWAINYEITRQIEILKRGKLPKQETRGFDPQRKITFSQRSKEGAEDYRYFPEPDIPPFEFSAKEIQAIVEKYSTALPWELEQEIISKGIPWQWAQILAEEKRLAEKFLKACKLGKKRKVSCQEIAKVLVNQKDAREKTAEELVETIVEMQNRFNFPVEHLVEIVETVVETNKKAVEDYKKGKKAAIGFLIGQVQRLTQGRADPQITRKLLIEEIKKLG